MSGKVYRNIWNLFAYIMLAVLTIICVIPFLSMFINATLESAVITSSFRLIPGKFTVRNYTGLIVAVNAWAGLRNSLFISCMTMIGAVYMSGITAYGFAKYRFKHREKLFWVLLATMMLPAQLGIIGVFQLMMGFGLLNSHFAIILPAMVNASAVFFIRQYIEGYFPDSIMESARIDGCGELKIFHRIAVPIIMPALATQAIFIFVASWNNFIGPLILLFDNQKFTLPLMIQQTQSSVGLRDWGVMYFGLSFAVLPILIVFIFCSRFMVKGLVMGSLKE